MRWFSSTETIASVEMTPTTSLPTRMGKKQAAPTAAAAGARRKRGSFERSATQIGSPVSATRPGIPSPTRNRVPSVAFRNTRNRSSSARCQMPVGSRTPSAERR
jgi:hypothetical protein